MQCGGMKRNCKHGCAALLRRNTRYQAFPMKTPNMSSKNRENSTDLAFRTMQGWKTHPRLLLSRNNLPYFEHAANSANIRHVDLKKCSFRIYWNDANTSYEFWWYRWRVICWDVYTIKYIWDRVCRYLRNYLWKEHGVTVYKDYIFERVLHNGMTRYCTNIGTAFMF